MSIITRRFAVDCAYSYNRRVKKEHRFRFGPGVLVTAAFIGPGTITTCTMAGARFGFSLLWTMLFAVAAVFILQEMSARLGIISGRGLGEALRASFPRGISRLVSLLLVLSAIAVGNAAYEAGNIAGASLGVTALLPEAFSGFRIWPLLLGLVAGVLLYRGSYKTLEKALLAMVMLMSLVFVITAVRVKPDISLVLSGLFKPGLPEGSLLTMIGLIGTTVVPYNLFLHSSAVIERWSSIADLKNARLDAAVSIAVGGVISMAVIVSAAVAFGSGPTGVASAGDLALQLEPLLGYWARLVMGLGLLAAGLTSAITAPLAAAYACSGILGWPRDSANNRFRLVWLLILSCGTLLACLGIRPIKLILFAQVANGLLLPVIAAYLLRVVNDGRLMGRQRNSLPLNLAGGLVLLITVLLGLRSILQVFKLI